MRVKQWVQETRLIKAWNLPPEVDERLDDMIEDLVQITFALIGDKLEKLGYQPSGDFAPEECDWIDSQFEAFIRSMAINNPEIAKLNPND